MNQSEFWVILFSDIILLTLPMRVAKKKKKSVVRKKEDEETIVKKRFVQVCG